MKLRTSYFNLTVLRKNITRFAPLWILASVFQVLLLLMIVSRDPGRVANDLSTIIGPMALYNVGYALLCATCLFGDLYKSKMCNALHAMPMKREGWLLTNLASGAIFALIPATLGCLCGIALTREFCQMALLWQGASLLQFVVFFGMAVFCALCAGTRLGAFGLYGVLNFSPLLLYVMSSYFYEPLLPSVRFDYEPILVATPFLQLTLLDGYAFFEYGKIESYFYGCSSQTWGYLWICAALGVLLLAAAWLVYRRRHLERAGEFITVKPMRYVFVVAFTLGVATFLHAIFDLFVGSGNYLFLAIGAVIGYFGGVMLLERSVKVFRGKVLIGFAAVCIAFLASCGVVAADPLGLTTYVPEAEKVEKAYVFLGYNGFGTPTFEDKTWGDTAEEIAAVVDIHKDLVENKETDMVGDNIQSKVVYLMKDGSTVERFYWAEPKGAAGQKIKAYFSDYRNLFEVDCWEELEARLVSVEACSYIDQAKYVNIRDNIRNEELLEALRKDCEAGLLVQDSNYYMQPEVYGVTVLLDVPDTRIMGRTNTRVIHLNIYSGCVNTIGYLNSIQWPETDLIY